MKEFYLYFASQPRRHQSPLVRDDRPCPRRPRLQSLEQRSRSFPPTARPPERVQHSPSWTTCPHAPAPRPPRVAIANGPPTTYKRSLASPLPAYFTVAGIGGSGTGWKGWGTPAVTFLAGALPSNASMIQRSKRPELTRCCPRNPQDLPSP